MVNDHPQAHCFKDPNDEDWFKFNGVAGRIYTIRTFDLESNADTVITLLDSALNILVGPEDISSGPGDESFDSYNYQALINISAIREYKRLRLAKMLIKVFFLKLKDRHCID
jgi:hypothetical protein